MPQRFILITFFLLGLVGCKPVYRPIVVKHSGSGILVLDHIKYLDEKKIPQYVRDECKLPKKLTSLIDKYGSEHYAQVLTNINIASVPANTEVLRVKIIDVIGGADGKAVTIQGALQNNGNIIADFKARRIYQANLFSGYKATCSILNYSVKALGKDIAKWLENPETNAALGDF